MAGEIITTASTIIQASDEVNINAVAELETLGIQLTGLLEKKGNDIRVLVTPGGNTFKQSITLQQIMENLGVGKADIASAASTLSYVGLTPEKTSISINQAFFYYTNVEAEQGTYADTKRTDKKSMEYALSISIDNEQKEQTSGVLKIKKIGFAVWNTTRKSIKDNLGMSTIENYLTEIEKK
jgi:hypothetical protein